MLAVEYARNSTPPPPRRKMNIVPNGSITTPTGFLSGVTASGLKTKGGLDLGILCSESPCVAAGVFTQNRMKAAPVVLSQRNLADGKARAIVVNAGCANACTGDQGLADAAEMVALAAGKLGIPAPEVLVVSTGVIGVPLLMNMVRAGIDNIAMSPSGGHQLARAIMTTDTSPKEIGVSLEIGRREVCVAGVAKGAGMIHPDMATLLSFLTTDAAVEPDFLKQALRRAVDVSFNMVSVDGDTSPNDSVLFLANGMAGNETLRIGGEGSEAFVGALEEVCVFLAKCIARDGEGATKFIEVTVEGALSLDDARRAARTVVSSPLVKSAVHGCDPNWGRVAAALGRSGADIAESRLGIYFGDLCLLKGGRPQPFQREQAANLLAQKEVLIRICLNLGGATATAWGCDLSEEYVTINSAYTT
ncbi:bifunctional glutamate N-acetyltransferase/amino-acid acetyltransferase ArgJ [Chloroflexota bacterium]